MSSCGIEPGELIDIRDDDERLPALCLIPEPIAERSAETSKIRGVQAQLEAATLAFAERFARAYFLTMRYGLVEVHEEFNPSDQRYEDMHPEFRHRWLMMVEQQLVKAQPAGGRVVSLVTGKAMQGLRRLVVRFDVPLSCMSMYQRRQQLAAFAKMTNPELLTWLFGFDAPRSVTLNAATPTSEILGAR